MRRTDGEDRGGAGRRGGRSPSTDTDPDIACAANVAICVGSAPNASTVTLVADVPAGSLLASWTGCTTVSADKRTCTISMTAAKTVTASYQPSTYALTAKTAAVSGAARGTITSTGTDPDIACAANTGTCVGSAPNASTVTLVADVPAGSLLTSWTGCTTVSADKRTCTVSMTAAKTVTANYQPSTYALTAKTAALSGAAQGTITSTGHGPGHRLRGEHGHLRRVGAEREHGDARGGRAGGLAARELDGVHDGLRGQADLHGVDDGGEDGDRELPAVDVRAHGEDVGGVGAAQGTITSTDTDPDIACAANTGTCVGSAPNASTVTLVADVPAGSLLASWTGCTTVSADKRTCTVSMTAAKTVTASYQPSTYAVTAKTAAVNGSGAGDDHLDGHGPGHRLRREHRHLRRVGAEREHGDARGGRAGRLAAGELDGVHDGLCGQADLHGLDDGGEDGDRELPAIDVRGDGEDRGGDRERRRGRSRRPTRTRTSPARRTPARASGRRRTRAR